jgi:predicted transcriptional regulator
MSTKDKLIERFKRQPKDFTFDELARLLEFLGFVKSNKGKTSGSRVKFNNAALKIAILVHKPHTTGAPVKETALKEIYDYLNSNNLI